MAILVTRTESQLSLTSSFQALDNLGGLRSHPALPLLVEWER